jgi:hypothetical protein
MLICICILPTKNQIIQKNMFYFLIKLPQAVTKDKHTFYRALYLTVGGLSSAVSPPAHIFLSGGHHEKASR